MCSKFAREDKRAVAPWEHLREKAAGQAIENRNDSTSRITGTAYRERANEYMALDIIPYDQP